MKAFTRVTVSGIIGGTIWMPSVVCAKQFTFRSDLTWSNSTLRDMVLEATNDGDFRDCEIIDATVVFDRIRVLDSGRTTVTRERTMDIRQFPSVADCVVEFESDAYYEAMDAMYGEFDEMDA